MSNRVLAAALGVREPTISEWRAGLYRPEAERLAVLAHLLEAPTVEFLGDDTPAPASVQSTVNETGSTVPDPLGLGLAGDPVGEMVRQGQAEAAAWVLEFAARLLEAGAQRLRQGVQRDQIIRAVEATEAVVKRQQQIPPEPADTSAPTPPTFGRRRGSGGPSGPPQSG